MDGKTALVAIGVGIGLAFGDAPKPEAPPRAKPKVIDLDFTGDDEDWPAAPKAAAATRPSPRWIYWTLGAGVVAAGGVGWYLFQDRQEPAVNRNEQVFTDER